MAVLMIDNGSDFIKAGFSDEDAPRAVFPTLVGLPHGGEGAAVVGEEAFAKRGELTLHSPIERGVITQWDDLERLW